MADLGPIIRRKADDPLPPLKHSSYRNFLQKDISSSSIAEKAALPTNLRGVGGKFVLNISKLIINIELKDLCPELLDTFRMMMSTEPLPLWPLQRVVTEVTAPAVSKPARESLSIEVARGIEPVGTIMEYILIFFCSTYINLSAV